MKCKPTMDEDSAGPLIAYKYRPGRVYLNITNRCTNACRFCSVRLNGGWLGPFNLDLAGKGAAPYRVHPRSPSVPWLPEPPDTKGRLDRAVRCEAGSPYDGPLSDESLSEAFLFKEPGTDEILACLDSIVAARDYPIKEVVFCGAGEPLIRLDTVLEISKAVKERGIKVRVNTNGHGTLIHGPDVLDRLKGLVDALSVSLNAQDPVTYRTLCRPAAGEEAYKALIDFAENGAKILPKVTLSIVTLTPDELKSFGVRIDEEACEAIARQMGCDFRLR